MKRFGVSHSRSACKVGVDGVLVGAWAPVPCGAPSRILDAGCGCGLIALMMAQRAPGAEVTAIEIDADAAAEALANARVSPWSRRITVLQEDFAAHIAACRALPPRMRYDVVVSNPPFFHSGGDAAESSRMLARHAGALSPEALVDGARHMLRPGGCVAFICQAESGEALLARARGEGLVLRRLTEVKGNPAAPVKRLLLEFQLGRGAPPLLTTQEEGAPQPLEDKKRVPNPATCIDVETSEPERDTLIIETSPGEYTPEYVALCRDFYLKF